MKKENQVYAYPPSIRAKALRLNKMGYTYNEIAEDTGVSPSSVFNWMKEERLSNETRKTAKTTRRRIKR